MVAHFAIEPKAEQIASVTEWFGDLATIEKKCAA
jgi:hypothetical protein